MSVISSFMYAVLANTLTEKPSRCSSVPRTFSSTPLPASSPMLTSCSSTKPPVTENCRGTSASETVRFQYVASTDQRSLKRPNSAPSSHSVDTSGWRALLPRFAGCTPGPWTEGAGLKVVNFANASGCRPDLPSAPRMRNVDSVSFVQSRP
jgi:hypothetical protein